MIELWLNFTDEKGEAKRVLAEGERFAIGRTPDNDLQIALGNLSRQHVKIERFADVFVISDCGSSNGSTLNGEKLKDPVALKNGDKLNLGGGVEIEIEMVSDKPNNPPPPPTDNDDDDGDITSSSAASASAGNSANQGGGGSSFPLVILLLVPVLGVFLLLIIGGVLLISKQSSGSEVVKKEKDFVYTSNKDDDDDDLPTNQKTPEKTETLTPTPTPSNSNNSTNSGGTTTPQPTETTTVSTPKPTADGEKIEINAASALRKIALNNPTAFLTSKQSSILSSKISQFKGSGALADNLKSAKKSASQLETMARSKNLKPQFLAIAAIAKLNNQRGDVVATAQSMLDILDNLSIPIGCELASECLLVIAAYEQGAEGKKFEMRDLLARECLPEKNPGVNCREIRTIWFLKDKGKISDSQFENALRFLAIATISQNPKDFNVDAEPLVLN